MSECRRPPPTLLTKSTSTVCAGIEPTFPHRQCGALDLWTNRPFARLCVTNLTIYVRPVIASHNRFILYVASFEPTIGIAGLEPTNYGTKARCLTVLAIFLIQAVREFNPRTWPTWSLIYHIYGSWCLQHFQVKKLKSTKLKLLIT